MDIPRPENKKRKRIRQIAIGSGTAVVLAILTIALSRLEPAAPSVDADTLYTGGVVQGELLIQTRGPGTLVPRVRLWIAAQSAGRVTSVLVRPGAAVQPDTVLVELSNPDLMRQAEEARYGLEIAKAKFAQFELELRSKELDQKAAVAQARAQYEAQRLQAEAERASGVMAELQVRKSELTAESLKAAYDIQIERYNQLGATVDAQIAAQRATLAQDRNAYDRYREQVEALHVRGGLAGVVQTVLFDEGAQVAAGANIARVAKPDVLMAELKVPETQAKDVLIDQLVAVDTRNGIVAGKVIRIDPAASEGTVQVDVELTGKLPGGARPEQSVDGTIEIKRLPNVLKMGRPTYVQANSTITLFKLVDDGEYAVRVPVRIGATSVNEVEVMEGLVPGDRVILSDTSAWDDVDRIRLN
ncbi:MAG TPA: HlyD family efflux transporter periplasmic adaptor subunit [Gammaproteobacteria bacterium]|nr:HlyD family efflux transporter periplasmic adaptor subunit [Gammaproteobacteria bacterium]